MELEVGQELKQNDIYTGICDVDVVCVNPTLETIEKLELPVKREEPVYIIGEGDDKKTLVKIWIKKDDLVLTPMTFFIQDKSVVASTGSIQFINDFGENTYAKDVDEAMNRVGENDKKFFREDGAREARVGEVDLINFIRKWLSVAPANTSKFNNFTKLTKGDMSELNGLIKAYGGKRKIQVLLTEKNGYQNVYTKYFERAGSKTTTYWGKHIAKQQSLPNYQNTFAFKKFNGISPDAEPVLFDEEGNIKPDSSNPFIFS